MKITRPDGEKTASSSVNTVSCNDIIVPATERQLQFETATLEYASALLSRKRRDLYSHFYHIEDELTTYEDYIERIRDGGDADLARQCIASILSGSSGPLTEVDKPTSQGKCPCIHSESSGPLTEVNKPTSQGISLCQELEFICLSRNWRLPRYFVAPSDGKFKSKVFVTGKGINIIESEGGLELKPYEARESAAARMIVKMHLMFITSFGRIGGRA